MGSDWLDGGVGPAGNGGGYRSALDARRSAVGRTPDAEYPDGYLGDVHSRREDRLASAVSNRLTDRHYQRGVHKGDKIPSDDYFWPDNFNPMSGIAAESRGEKWTAIGSTPAEQINHMGKNHMLAPEELRAVAGAHGIATPVQMDPIRQAQMRPLLPSWSV